jgi:hypothetical protein
MSKAINNLLGLARSEKYRLTTALSVRVVHRKKAVLLSVSWACRRINSSFVTTPCLSLLDWRVLSGYSRGPCDLREWRSFPGVSISVARQGKLWIYLAYSGFTLTVFASANH